MIITEQQYNSVVSGLRTQLELLRAQVQEKVQLFHQQVGETQKAQAGLDQMRNNCESWIDRSEEAERAIKTATEMARGNPGVVVADASTLLAAELFDEIGILRTKLQKRKK